MATLTETAGLWITDLFGWVARGVQGMGAIVLAVGLGGFGCQAASPDPQGSRPAPAPVAAKGATAVEPPQPAPEPEPGPRLLGPFNVTFYYVVGEEEMIAKPKPVVANDNAGSGSAELAAQAPPERVTMYNYANCEPIVEATREFVYEVTLQGTGRLRDGRYINVTGPCNCPASPCFRLHNQQWGVGGSGRALQPFRSVAVDPKVIKLGSLLYVPLLEGRTMPGRPPWGGFVHDGCVMADDTGGLIRGNQLDLFVGRRAWFLGPSGAPGPHSWARHIPVFDGSKICERQGRKISRKTGVI